MGLCLNRGSYVKQIVTPIDTDHSLTNHPEVFQRKLFEKTLSLPALGSSGALTERRGSFPRTTLSGVISDLSQSSFTDKKVSLEGGLLLAEISYKGIGLSCKKGLKPESPNQDDFSITLDPNFTLLIVFDGHGFYGHEISNYVKKTLPVLIANKLPTRNVQGMLTACFEKCNSTLKASCESGILPFDCENSGTTVTAALVQNSTVHFAHVGDSRAVFGLKSQSTYRAIRTTEDHKPDLLLEKQRILSKKGAVYRLPDELSHRVYRQDEDGPGLSVSRAIGDSVAQSVGVIPTPEVREFQITPEAQYLVICSDGIWEFITDDEVVEVVSRFGSNSGMAAERLANMAWARWIQEEGDTVDDLTALVVYLPKLIEILY